MKLTMLKLGRQEMSILLVFVLVASASVGAILDNTLSSPVVKHTRRLFNFGSIFGSATNASPYDRIGGHPVFQVTTPWGSPYMNMEKLTDRDEAVKPGNPVETQEEYRSVALFFMDPDDALSVHGEMSQMEAMSRADIRITSCSLTKAIRQASHLGNGALTGFPPEPLTGKLKTPQEGGSLRYKIVPPKRQLYYAARCKGRERVGLQSDSPGADAEACIIGNSALDSLNLGRRRDKVETTFPKKKTPMQKANIHMDGYTGIPVFYVPGMQRRLPRLKQLFSGVARETPLFFNYEDLEEAWSTMRKRSGKKASKMPATPPDVEVFNLWDVLTSVERDIWNKKKNTPIQEKAISALKDRFVSPKEEPGLGSITFVPSSRSINYKQSISARGNGKSKLRPMREWGYQTM